MKRCIVFGWHVLDWRKSGLRARSLPSINLPGFHEEPTEENSVLRNIHIKAKKYKPKILTNFAERNFAGLVRISTDYLAPFRSYGHAYI
ncbi:hypothetical protein QE152_g28434 [Popillia japonica]|uniref:Uncharacterized protein n=1 Tax=Popillia japonica TaxID=7064 RepID=A0AAW1JJJ9_POPJA